MNEREEREKIIENMDYGEKTLAKMNFDDLCNECSTRIHLKLLEEGGQGLKTGVILSLNQAIQWIDVQRKIEEQVKKNALAQSEERPSNLCDSRKKVKK